MRTVFGLYKRDLEIIETACEAEALEAREYQQRTLFDLVLETSEHSHLILAYLTQKDYKTIQFLPAKYRTTNLPLTDYLFTEARPVIGEASISESTQSPHMGPPTLYVSTFTLMLKTHLRPFRKKAVGSPPGFKDFNKETQEGPQNNCCDPVRRRSQ